MSRHIFYKKKKHEGDSLSQTTWTSPLLYAGIDVGSHTVRMLIVEEKNDSLRPIVHRRYVTRLADGFEPSKCLAKRRKLDTLNVLREYRHIMEELCVAHAECGATGVVRKARDGNVFAHDMEGVLGFPCRIISETEEAITASRGTLTMLTAQGVISDNEDTPIVIFDLGGGSTEFTAIKSGECLLNRSIFIGAATITARFFPNAPAHPTCLNDAAQYVDDSLKGVVRDIKDLVGPSFFLIGTAGTVASLGAMYLMMINYVPYRMMNTRLPLSWIQERLQRLTSLSLAERRNIPGLEPGREDVIIGGTVIAERIMSLLGASYIIVSDAGLLEGLALEAAEKFLGRPHLGLFSSLTWCFEPIKGENNFSSPTVSAVQE